MASRMAARSTMAGTPVKSCMITRAGVNAISWLGAAFGSHCSSASMSSRVTFTPSSNRSRFSSRILSEKGRRDRSWPLSAGRLKISYDWGPTASVVRALKLSLMDPPGSAGRD